MSCVSSTSSQPEETALLAAPANNSPANASETSSPASQETVWGPGWTNSPGTVTAAGAEWNSFAEALEGQRAGTGLEKD